jgi:DNA mismatch repair protein MutS2
MNAHALDVLEFGPALETVARLASSELGAQLVRGLRPVTDAASVEEELATVGEFMALLERETRWAMPGIPDLRESLRRLPVEGSVWDAASLRAAAVLIASSAEVRRFFRSRTDAPRLAAVTEVLAELTQLGAAVERAIDENGAVRDDASPELSRLRREMQGARSRIVARLSSFAASLPAHFQVPDGSVSVREGRYVIPIRREGRGEVGGIVHDESGTGATLFVEPPVAIDLMNRLRELEAAQAREVHRILRELTARLRPHAGELEASLAALTRLDSLLARARYATRLGGTPPRVLPPGTPEYEVVDGRHPLLLVRAEAVVPFDLRMEVGERTLLISGPNTGGKTVLLKAVGLISLLAQSGVVPPVGPGTRLPVFRRVFADIGDEQSIEASLSTFSAHLKNLRETLEQADAESLVLIDEIGSGTDPVEGGALAQSILLELTRRSALTVATTHLGQLKLLPTEEPRVVNASLQFDAERLAPTYRLTKGVPGRSYGIAIARRLGIPEGILATAEAALPRGERDVAKLLLELEAKEQKLAETSARLETELARTTVLRAELEKRQENLRTREKDSERRARQQARDLLLTARREVDAAIQEVRGAADEAKLEEAARAARRRVEEAARQQQQRTDAPPEPELRKQASDAPIEVGARVRIESIGRTGTVVELRDSKATVETAGMRMVLPRRDLTVLPPEHREEARPRAWVPSGGGYVAADLEAGSEVDLRGMRVDELSLQLGRALDSALLSGLPTFRIIHGKGTGALRAEVHELLKADPRIASHRPGERYEGGTGVTVVEFR